MGDSLRAYVVNNEAEELMDVKVSLGFDLNANDLGFDLKDERDVDLDDEGGVDLTANAATFDFKDVDLNDNVQGLILKMLF